MQITLPKWFEDEEAIYTAKGCVLQLPCCINGTKHLWSFYDTTRLMQDIAEEFKWYDYFYEKEIVVLHAVTKENILIFLKNHFQQRTQEQTPPA